jgi:hypothetical protein
MVWVTGVALIAALLEWIWLLENVFVNCDRAPSNGQVEPWKPQVFGSRRLSCFSSTTSSRP